MLMTQSKTFNILLFILIGLATEALVAPATAAVDKSPSSSTTSQQDIRHRGLKRNKKGEPHCRDFEFVVKRSDIQRFYDEDSGQETSVAPIYSFEDGYTNLQRVGVVERKVQYINKVDSSNGAMLWLSQSFEYDPSTGVYKSQFSSVGTGAGDFNSVVGGFGAFECATGTELHTVIELDDGQELVLREIHICGGCGNKIRGIE